MDEWRRGLRRLIFVHIDKLGNFVAYNNIKGSAERRL